MKGSGQFLVIFRRMSVVYTFLVAAAVILLVYYYYIIPGKKAEFADRSSRTLRTLVQNCKKEVEGLASSFMQTSLSDPGNRRQLITNTNSYQKLYENIHYEIDTTWTPPGKERIQYHNDWKLIFRLDSTKWWVQVPVQNFSERIFISRTDVFSSYILLLPDTAKTQQSKIQSWYIIYKQNQVTNSDRLLLDSAGLFRNSDMSTVAEATIAGKVQKIFLNSFSLGNQTVLLGGVISKAQYDNYVHSIPVNYVVGAIIFIIVLLIILPLLKIYLLSRNETIYSKDVIAACLSIFMGTAAILLILIFSYLYTISSESFHNRMNDIGGQIRADIKNQLDSASKQLDSYVDIYTSLSSGEEKKVLTNTATDSATIKYVDSVFYPGIFPDLTRVLWFDSAGQTLAKWNPFNFITPLTSVKDYEFFTRIKAINDGTAFREKMVVYSGKSNLTGEFQVYIAKPVRQNILTVEKKKYVERNSIGILLATSLHCNTLPVLPPGFDFCLLDNRGRVLLHSDENRNLSENFYEETGYNQQLMSNVQQKTDDVIRNVTLYGNTHDIVIKPLGSQPLSIAVFYPTKRTINNISRFLHFSITCLCSLFAIIIFFILYLTYRNSKPSQLRFHLNKVQWIRPAAGNQFAYRFSQWYFFTLIVVSVLSFICIQLLDFDFRDILYLSFLLPFYALVGLITANQKLIREDRQVVIPFSKNYKKILGELRNNYNKSLPKFTHALYKQITNALVLSGLLIAFLNFQFLYFLWTDEKLDSKLSAIGPLLFIQLLFISAFLFFYRNNRDKLNRTLRDENPEQESKDLQNETGNVENPSAADTDSSAGDNEKVPDNYLWSLYFALILLTVLPTFGIATYAFFAEKTQYKKTKELFIAQSIDRKYRFLQSQYKSSYKPHLKGMDSISRPGLSLLIQGNYLSDHDIIEIKERPGNISTTIYDESYRAIVNELYTHTSSLFGEFAIGNRSKDSTWQFASQHDSLELYYKYPRTDSLPVKVSSYYQTPLLNFWTILRNGGIIFPVIIILFLVFLFWYLGATIHRLFLLDFAKPCNVSSDFLNKYFRYVSTDPLYPHDHNGPITIDFFKEEEERRKDPEQYILKMTFCFTPVYNKIWNDLSEKEKYTLYDLSRDGYTNYKNTDVIFQLLTKGLLRYEDYRLQFFALSFQNYVLGQKETPKMQELLSKYNTGGLWRSLRVPLILISVTIGTFFILTQSSVAHDLVAFVTSILALVPLLVQLFGRSNGKGES